MLAKHILILLLQMASSPEPSTDVLLAEAKDVLEQLQNAPYPVAKNSVGSEWFMRARDLDKGGAGNELVWVTKYIHAYGDYRDDLKTRHLIRVDCVQWTYRDEISQTFSADGNVKRRRQADKNVPMVEPVAESPMESVMNAFCAPEFER